MNKQMKLSALLLIMCSLFSVMNSAEGHDGGGHGGFGGGGFGGGHGGGFGGGDGWHGGGGYGGWHGGHGGYGGRWYGGGIYFGSPFYYPYYAYPYYSYPYSYYSPTIVTTPAAPPVYIQQAPQPQQQPSQNLAAGYWYYCHNPEGYYPYIKQCPGGWQQVAPTPPPAQ